MALAFWSIVNITALFGAEYICAIGAKVTFLIRELLIADRALIQFLHSLHYIMYGSGREAVLVDVVFLPNGMTGCAGRQSSHGRHGILIHHCHAEMHA